MKAIHRELNQLLAPTPMAEIDMEMTQPQFGYQGGGEEKDTNTVKSKGKGKKRASPAFEQSDEESEVKYQPKNKKRLSSILEDDEDDEAVPPPQQQTKAFTGLSEQDKLLQKMKLLHKKLSDPSKKMVNKQVLSPSSSYQVPTLSSSTSSSLQVTNAASTSNKRPPYLVGWRKDSIVYKMVMLLQEKRKRISDQIDAANKLQGKETTFVASAKPFQEDYYYEDLEEEEEQPKKKAKTAKAVAAPLFQQFAMPPSPVKQSAPIPSQKSPMKNHRVVAAVEPPRGPPTSSSRASVSSSSSTATTKQQQTPSTSSNASFPILTHQDILSKTLKFLQKKVNKKV